MTTTNIATLDFEVTHEESREKNPDKNTSHLGASNRDTKEEEK